jgi:YgiT-type zinc finger domain-containing protein
MGWPRVERATWARLVGSDLVVVPDIEALVCDACGAVDYDHETLDRLEALLILGAPGGPRRPQISPSTRVPGEAWSSDRPIRAV